MSMMFSCVMALFFSLEASPQASGVDDSVEGPGTAGKRSPQVDNEAVNILFSLSVTTASPKVVAFECEAQSLGKVALKGFGCNQSRWAAATFNQSSWFRCPASVQRDGGVEQLPPELVAR